MIYILHSKMEYSRTCSTDLPKKKDNHDTADKHKTTDGFPINCILVVRSNSANAWRASKYMSIGKDNL